MLPVPSCLLGFSTCRVDRYPRWLPPFSPLCRALTSATGDCSVLVGASPGGVVCFWQRWRVYGQLKPFRRIGVSSLRLCSSRVNTKYAWHLVSAHAASGIASIRPNQSRKPTAPLGNASSVFATTPCHVLSLSR